MPKAAANPGPEPMEILLVEDEEHDIELTLHTLKRHNIPNRIYVARDGAEALEFLADREVKQAAGTGSLPKLIMLDLNLPKISGIQVLEEITSNPATKDITVGIFSSYTWDQGMIQSRLHGVSRCLQKPLQFDEFSDLVKEIGMC